jgi:hypothetical protein
MACRSRRAHPRKFYRCEPLERRRLLATAISFSGAAPYSDPDFIPTTLAVGFMNAGSLPDLVVGDYVNGTVGDLRVLLGNGDGTMRAGSHVLLDFNAHTIRTGDVNNDGKTDAVYAGSISQLGSGFIGKIKVRTGNGDGSLNAESPDPADALTSSSVYDFQLAHLNSDGKLDMIVTNSDGMRILRGMGDGTFQYYSGGTTGEAGNILVTDFNADGKSDLVLSTDIDGTLDGHVTLLRGNGDFTFTQTDAATLRTSTTEMKAGDFNGDGKMDFAFAEFAFDTTGARYWVQAKLGDGAGHFVSTWEYEMPLELWSLAVADYDGDFNLDLALGTTAHTSNSFLIMRGRGDGTFMNPQPIGVGTSDTYFLTSADFNVDGRADVALSLSNPERVQVFLNTAQFHGMVQGRLWEDEDQDDNIDPGEVGIGGRTVWADNDDDGVVDPAEDRAITKADGTYKLIVPPGTHKVRQLLPPGWIQPGFPPHGAIPPAYLVTVAVREIRSGFDFPAYFKGTISGRVYNDFNANQTFDVYENGSAGRTVYIDANNNGVFNAGEATAVTNAQGVYKFNLPAGTYVVRQALPAGWLQTTPAGGAAHVVFASSSQPAQNKDFGATQLGSISGRVYYDVTANQISDDSDPGVSGFTVYIDYDGDAVLDPGEPSTTTNAQGNYTFTNLYPQAYLIRIIKPPGWQQTTPPAPSPGADGGFATRANGGFDSSYTDFGVIQPAHVSGKVYEDLNGDGIRQANEPGLANWNVFVDVNGDGGGGFNEPFGTTNASGDYSLTVPVGGTYTVRIVPLSGWNSTAPPGGAHVNVPLPTGANVTGRNFGLSQGPLNNAGFATPVNYASFGNPVAVVTGDFDNDQNPDFAVANNSADVKFFRGDGLGGFTASSAGFAGASIRGLLAADLNNDGKLDLVTANADTDNVSVLLGNGDGKFQTNVDYPASIAPFSVAAGDFNNDGKLDLVAGSKFTDQLAILYGNGNGTFQNPTFRTIHFASNSVAVGDFNNDTRPDIVSASEADNSLAILLGGGSGTFADPAYITTGIVQPTYVAIRDLNNNATQDLVVVMSTTDQIRVIPGNGNGTFGGGTSLNVGSAPHDVTFGDFDADGKIDLGVSFRSDGTTDISGGVNLLLGNGNLTFDPPLITTAHTSPTAAGVADFDRDGLADLAVANFFSDDASVLINSRTASNASISGVVFQDTDADGIKDGGEIGLNNWQVYIDADNDDALDAGETVVVTDIVGAYTIGNLPAGTYVLREIVKPGYARLFPPSGAEVVPLAAGQVAVNRNFANAAVQFNAGQGAGQLGVRLDAGGQNVEVFQGEPGGGGATMQKIPLSSSSPLQFTADTGGSTLAIDFSAGDPISAGGIDFFVASAGLHLLRVTGAGSLDLGSDVRLVGGGNVGLDVSGAALVTLAGTATRFSSVAIGAGGRINLAPDTSAVLETQDLQIAAGGLLDLHDNDVIVNYSSVSPVGIWTGTAYDGLAGMIQAGKILTSSAIGSRHALGVAEARDALGLTGTATATFAGRSVDSTTVLLKFTWGGDPNLDGKINIDDYGRIDGNVAQSGVVFGWFNGDFNLDGKINIDDYGIIDGNINQQDQVL